MVQLPSAVGGYPSPLTPLPEGEGNHGATPLSRLRERGWG